jgi:hypothetical protein
MQAALYVEFDIRSVFVVPDVHDFSAVRRASGVRFNYAAGFRTVPFGLPRFGLSVL